MKKEIWKDIKGYENKYQVSNKGRVKRLSYKIFGKVYPDRVLKQDYIDGEPMVILFKNNNSERFEVKALMELAEFNGEVDFKEKSQSEIVGVQSVIEVYKDGIFILKGLDSRILAEKLISNGLVDNKNIETVSRGIRKAIQKNKIYLNLTFKETYEKRYLLAKNDKKIALFNTLSEMADWLLASGTLTGVRKETVIRNIRKAIKENKTYHNFEIIDNN